MSEQQRKPTTSPKADRLRAAFDHHLARPTTITKRHPAEVTADRLGDAVGKYRHLIDGAEADAFALVIQVLTEIAEGDRA